MSTLIFFVKNFFLVEIFFLIFHIIFQKTIFENFINNTMFCNILVCKCRYFEFIVKNLDRNFFGC